MVPFTLGGEPAPGWAIALAHKPKYFYLDLAHCEGGWYLGRLLVYELLQLIKSFVFRWIFQIFTIQKPNLLALNYSEHTPAELSSTCWKVNYQVELVGQVQFDDQENWHWLSSFHVYMLSSGNLNLVVKWSKYCDIMGEK